MTTISYENDLIESIVKKWKKENPYEVSMSATAITTRILVKYLNKKGDKNEI